MNVSSANSVGIGNTRRAKLSSTLCVNKQNGPYAGLVQR